jgi:hypothetical protein
VTATSGIASASPLAPLERFRLAGEIAAAYAVARWRLRRYGLRPTLAALRDAGAGAAPAAALDERQTIGAGRRLGRAVTRTLGVLPADSRCLMCSLVLTRLLARRGIESELVISVRPGERFAAHAWLERGGAPLLPPDAPESARLTTL